MYVTPADSHNVLLKKKSEAEDDIPTWGDTDLSWVKYTVLLLLLVVVVVLAVVVVVVVVVVVLVVRAICDKKLSKLF